MISENVIEKALKELFANPGFALAPEGLYDPLRYMIEIGGKRIRPRLCLTAYGLFRDTLDESVLQCASALEVFHTFTLIHDDIMDKSPLRRKRETVWKKWNEDTAILSGDVMCIDSYRRIANAPASVLGDVLVLFNRTAAQVCEGQQLDMDFEKRKDVTMAEYLEMIGLKTGVLIACSAKMGALVAGAPEEACDRLYDYGYLLGLAFQVADDYLDAYGDEKVFGKPIGGDILNAKKCWLTTRAFEKADAPTRARLMELLDSEAVTDEQKTAKIEAVKAIYDSLDIPEDARREIRRFSDEAMERAAAAVSGLNLAALKDFAETLIGRNC